jgi:ribokinase
MALARLGARVEMVGALGDDVLGTRYANLLRDAGIGSGGVAVMAGISTGTASIEVAASGENKIIIVAGANGELGPAQVESRRAIVEATDFLLLQLEIPMESVVLGARLARAAGRTVILDPAPARELPPELYPLVSIITPNETEAAILTGCDTGDEAGIARAGAVLLERGARAVVIKAGGRGAYLVDASGCRRVPGFPVKVVDTVAAGDSFNAGLAFALGDLGGKGFAGRGIDHEALLAALPFANAVGGLSTTKEGAQDAMPTRREAEALMARPA